MQSTNPLQISAITSGNRCVQTIILGFRYICMRCRHSLSIYVDGFSYWRLYIRTHHCLEKTTVAQPVSGSLSTPIYR